MDNLKIRYGTYMQQAYATMLRRMWEADWLDRAAIRAYENCSWIEWSKRNGKSNGHGPK